MITLRAEATPKRLVDKQDLVDVVVHVVGCRKDDLCLGGVSAIRATKFDLGDDVNLTENDGEIASVYSFLHMFDGLPIRGDSVFAVVGDKGELRSLSAIWHDIVSVPGRREVSSHLNHLKPREALDVARRHMKDSFPAVDEKEFVLTSCRQELLIARDGEIQSILTCIYNGRYPLYVDLESRAILNVPGHEKAGNEHE